MDFTLGSAKKQLLTNELRNRLENGIDLPVLPEVARELILLRNKPAADISDLVAIVAQDPVISGQIMRHGRMSIYGYGERITSLNDAVQLVLGYEKALHLAMGLSAGKSLRIMMAGPLGQRAVWRCALKNSFLSQGLAKELATDIRPSLGLSYLAGLMHDIGYLVFGVLYPQEFSELNDMVDKYDQIGARELEFHAVGVSHDMIGSLLLHNWNLPEEVVIAAAEHHFPDYGGKHAIYAKLVYLANQLIHNDAEATYSDKTMAVFNELGLDDTAVQRVLESFNNMESDFEVMVEELVA